MDGAVTAVSYTHLDVYKRQVVKLINILSQAHLKFYLNSFALRMQNDLNIPT